VDDVAEMEETGWSGSEACDDRRHAHGERRVANALSPFLSRSVITGSGSTSWSSTSRNVQRCPIVLTSSISSIQANGSPMQRRDPPPNGKYANGGRLALNSGVHRSGRKRSGSEKYRGSRWVMYGLSSTSARDGSTKSPTGYSLSARRPIIHAGG